MGLDQPRTPAGSPEGGEFASSGGGGAGGGGGKETNSGTSPGRAAIAKAEAADSPHWTAKTETGFAALADGTSIEISGTKDALEINPADRKKFRDVTLTHNHPPGSDTLSGADVAWARWADAKEIRAFGTDAKGQRWIATATRPPGGWPKATNVDFMIAYNNASGKDRKSMIPRVAKGELSLDDAFNQSREKVHLAMAKKFGFTYERKAA